MSPRATLALQRVARARAAASGRTYVVPDDLKALVEPVIAHRLLVTPEAQIQGVSPADALIKVLRSVPVPAGEPRARPRGAAPPGRTGRGRRRGARGGRTRE